MYAINFNVTKKKFCLNLHYNEANSYLSVNGTEIYKVFNLMSRTNERRFIEWHETCKCKCRLDAIICNNKQRWNKNKCRCECK